jgi:transmembrane sensor
MDTRFKYLLDSYTSGTLTPHEKEELFDMLRNENQELLINGIAEHIKEGNYDGKRLSVDEASAAVRNILSLDKSNLGDREITIPPLPADLQSADTPSVHRVHFLKTAWVRYAAAILIILGIGSYLYISNQKEKPSVTQVNPNPVKNDVAPGGNRATLTLADGSKIVLDSAKNGKLADEINAAVVKNGDKLVYEKNNFKKDLPSPREGSGEDSKIAVSYNTLATPRGGQYQLTLADGSQVWLNAESSIRYPTAFAGKERKVTVTGEAYFEVTKDKSKPFIVAVTSHPSALTTDHENQALEIEVLGTHFNVNAYNEEPTINTTLLEGSVKLTSHPSPLTSVLTLKPGQQGQLNDQKLVLAKDPDIEQVMAWKEGKFYFNQQDIKSILTQFARWYDVEVIYQGQLKNRKFFGIVSRSSSLSQVLKLLEDSGIKFKIENRKLYVQSD